MKIFNNQLVRYVVILLIGCGLGSIFYPSKTITTEETEKYKQTITKLESEKYKSDIKYVADLSRLESENKQYKEVTTNKIHSLKEENYKLKSRVTEKRFKIVRPDGTIEERWFKESETDIISSTVTSIKSEFTRKVQSIENKWKKIHEKRIKELKTTLDKKLISQRTTTKLTQKKTKTEINKRSFGISLGLTDEKDYFSSISYDFYGPIFLDLHLESDSDFKDKEIGVGIGMRW